jgi:Mg2+-importing ATPase
MRVGELETLANLMRSARPGWLCVAMMLQASTYLVEGSMWWWVGQVTRFPVPFGLSSGLSLVKLFTDQALPSVGLSGTLVASKVLQRMGMRQDAIVAGVVLRLASYYLAYAICLGIALLISIRHGHASGLIVVTSASFILFATLVSIGMLALTGRRPRGMGLRLARLTQLQRGLQMLRQADRSIARNAGLLIYFSLMQTVIIALDTATLCALLAALGASAAPADVFSSFMVSTLFRSLGFLPGGLGSFEAVSIMTLHATGLSVEVALAATFLFRGLSFWLPMLPGFWLSRRLVAGSHATPDEPHEPAYWSVDAETLLERFATTRDGLSSAEALERLRQYGENGLEQRHDVSRLKVLWNQLANPLLLILVFAALVSTLVGEWSDAVIVLVVIIASVGIGYFREYRAQTAATALKARIQMRANVLRDGVPVFIPARQIVPGDVILLAAGSLVPADAVIIESADCYLSEAVLTGESFPVLKRAGILAADAPLAARWNCVFLGTNVRSGAARCIVATTGSATAYGGIAGRLSLRPPQTEFDRGLLRFGYLLTSAMLLMVTLVFVANVAEGRPPIDTLLFAIALAVGLSPELLPAILSVNLARGAEMMSRRGVLVRHLPAIENLGSMDVLCTDKTGTITEGVVSLEGAYDECGTTSEEVLRLGALNAALESGLDNPLDEAITQAYTGDVGSVRKLGEIPFDFTRKRISVIVAFDGGALLIAKGAVRQVLEACSTTSSGLPLDEQRLKVIEQRCEQWAGNGIRVLAVASRTLAAKDRYDRNDENGLQLRGFLTFLDRPKPGVVKAIADLRALGISVKVISGDSKLVAQHIARIVGMEPERILTGRQLDALADEALWHAAEVTDLFVEVDPNQKERIILALRKMGHVVGFLGDGVNDAPAMHAADTSLSVEQATDVAREAADFVLLERDLEVIRQGVVEGRRTFANTLKYVLITTSANLGNMVSMAAASLYLPFLPLTAGQILLNNLLSDVPAVGIADDSVDPELIDRPRRWDMRFIGRYMVEFGLLSSAFDILTFAVLLSAFAAPAELFRTGWFIESLLTELVIAMVVRTRRPIHRSRPGRVLLSSTVVLCVVTLMIPYIPYAQSIGFVPLPAGLLVTLIGITMLYVAAAELTKRWFYRGNP